LSLVFTAHLRAHEHQAQRHIDSNQ